jgi:hypothetical protein
MPESQKKINRFHIFFKLPPNYTLAGFDLTAHRLPTAEDTTTQFGQLYAKNTGNFVFQYFISLQKTNNDSSKIAQDWPQLLGKL